MDKYTALLGGKPEQVAECNDVPVIHLAAHVELYSECRKLFLCYVNRFSFSLF